MSDRTEGITTGRASALGLVQGPAELLPISSSAHIVLIPWLAGSLLIGALLLLMAVGDGAILIAAKGWPPW